jgi:DNA-binding response OmpR family regulator
MRSGLERNGFSVTTFDDPDKALSQFEAKRYDKIVLDLRMPGMTGVQLAKQIWAKDPKARICFFSAFDMYEKEAKAEFKDLNGVFFIEKPITPRELAKRIAENLQLYK